MLVIDNADNPLVDVSRFFPAGDRGHILVTSRNKECRHLQTVGYEELKEMDHEEAVTLLLRSSDKDHNNPRYRNSARPIAKALGYLPLALDQAGAAIRQDICTLRNYLSVYNRHRKQVMGTRSIQGSEAYKYTVYTTWEVSFQMIKKLEKPASVDACEILQIFAFFHFQQVPASLLQRAWASALQATSSSVSVSLFSRILGLLSPAVDDNGITQSSQLLRRAGQSWDVIRFRRALSILAQFSMIARDADREEDSYQTPDDDRTSLRSYTAVSGNYSMHPLVHFWVRDRMDKADQNRWFEIATAALADSITADPDPAEHAYRRALIPHIDCFFNGEHTKPLIADQTNVRQLERAFNITQVYAEGGRWNSARELQERVVDERIALLGAEHDDTLAAMASLASTYWNSGLMDKVADLRRRVLDLKTRRFGSKDCRTLEAMDELAKAYWLCGRWAEAEALSLDAVNGMREVLGPTDPSVLTATLNLARLHKHKGRPEKGLAILARSRDDCLKEYGPEHALSLEATMELGMIYHAIGRFSEAESLLLGVLETRRRVLGKDHAYTLWAVNDLSKIYCSQGRAVEAEEMILAILDVVEETLGKEHVGMTMTMSNLARAYSTQGRFTDAEAVLDSLHDILARKISTGKIDPLHPDWLECLYKEARNYMQLGRVKDAERTYIEVIPMLEKKLGPEHPWTCNAKVRLEEIQKPLSPLTPVEQTAGM